jgi:hypothetical protein
MAYRRSIILIRGIIDDMIVWFCSHCCLSPGFYMRPLLDIVLLCVVSGNLGQLFWRIIFAIKPSRRELC